MPFDIFIDDLDDGTECTCRKFADCTNLRGAAGAQGSWTTIQRDLNKLENSPEVQQGERQNAASAEE